MSITIKISVGGGRVGWSNQLLCHSHLELRLSWAVTTTSLTCNIQIFYYNFGTYLHVQHILVK